MEVPTVAVDYCFSRNAPGEESIPVLLMGDRETRLHCVRCPDDGLHIRTVRDLGTGTSWKAGQFPDQEAALRSLVSEVGTSARRCSGDS